MMHSIWKKGKGKFPLIVSRGINNFVDNLLYKDFEENKVVSKNEVKKKGYWKTSNPFYSIDLN